MDTHFTPGFSLRVVRFSPFGPAYGLCSFSVSSLSPVDPGVFAYTFLPDLG